MADSNITKKALSVAFKELLDIKSFERITVAEICEKCEMNRKSFYYHFKDKYDLVNWIFDTEFLNKTKASTDDWFWVEAFCNYMYENQKFYRKVLSVEGQNSFSSCLEETINALIEQRLELLFKDEPNADFCMSFYSDAFVCAIKRWLLKNDTNSLTGKQVCQLLHKLILEWPNKNFNTNKEK